jgi:hypothetical protein
VEAFKESTGIKVGAIHGNGRGYTENCIIERYSVLPFRQQALPVERTQLGVAQPNGGQVRHGAAGTGGHLDADHSIFAAIALGPLDTQFMESFEIMLIDRRDGAAFFGCLDECPERLE